MGAGRDKAVCYRAGDAEGGLDLEEEEGLQLAHLYPWPVRLGSWYEPGKGRLEEKICVIIGDGSERKGRL